MEDLISRKDLINQIKLVNNRSSLGETVSGFNLSGTEVVGIIKDMPVAFDYEAMIDKLNKCTYPNVV